MGEVSSATAVRSCDWPCARGEAEGLELLGQGQGLGQGPARSCNGPYAKLEFQVAAVVIRWRLNAVIRQRKGQRTPASAPAYANRASGTSECIATTHPRHADADAPRGPADAPSPPSLVLTPCRAAAVLPRSRSLLPLKS